MRIALFAVLVGACASNDPPQSMIPGCLLGCPGSEEPTTECTLDSDCSSGDVCTRDHECLPPSDVRAIHVTWTIERQPATADICGDVPDLALGIGVSSDGYPTFSFAPVACDEGEFTIDKLSTEYDYAWLSEEDWPIGSAGALDGSGDAALDLPY